MRSRLQDIKKRIQEAREDEDPEELEENERHSQLMQKLEKWTKEAWAEEEK